VSSGSARDASALGAYVIPGTATDSRAAVSQAIAADRLGMGSVWLSELQGPMKDAGALLGAMGEATTTVRVGTSITHFGTRHPIVLASWAATMQALTGGRFEFGFGRSVPFRWRAWGLPVPTLRSMEDHADILRRLWRGETVAYDGPAGSYPHLDAGVYADGVEPPPLLLAALGPKTLDLSGRCFDGVLLYPFLTAEGAARSRAIVRASAERAGRDPDAVKVYVQVVTVADASDEEVDRRVRRRAVGYVSGGAFAEILIDMNGWDRTQTAALDEEMERLRTEHGPMLGREALDDVTALVPDEWVRRAAAIGTSADCAARFHEYLDAGIDGVIVHETTPDDLHDVVEAFVAG
jgi:5,10-methylenetetrahydromethanopterin reductase